MTSHNHVCSRRGFLLGAASTFAGAVLVACGSSGTKAAVADIPVGSATIVGDAIIAQPTAGEYKVYSNACPHQGYPITQVNGDTVKCTRHGSTFSIKDGSVQSGPSRAGLVPKEFSKEGDEILVKK